MEKKLAILNCDFGASVCKARGEIYRIDFYKKFIEYAIYSAMIYAMIFFRNNKKESGFEV